MNKPKKETYEFGYLNGISDERKRNADYYDMWDKLKEYLLDDGWSEVSGEVAVILVLNKMENLGRESK